MAARQVTPKLDAVAAAAVDLARQAAVDVAGPDVVGEHLGASAEGERVVVHRFSTLHRGYVGWVWTVVLARVPRARTATVSEVVLLPGEGALLPPAWLPWSDRVAPGDLGETDVLPFREDDPLLDEGYETVGGADAAQGDEMFDDVDVTLGWELGLGRKRVVNREGRIEAATRWHAGDHGPDNAVTRASSAACTSCGYLVGLTGSLRQQFGVCANAWSPDDGKVVSLDHGCGAHSETGPTAEEPEPLPDPLVDDLRPDLDTEVGAVEPEVVEPEVVEPEVVEPEVVEPEMSAGQAGGDGPSTEPGATPEAEAVEPEVSEGSVEEASSPDTEPSDDTPSGAEPSDGTPAGAEPTDT